MKRLSAVVVGVVALGLAGFAAADDKDDLAKKVVGKWEISKGGDLPAGTAVEFTKDGKVSITVLIDGKETKIDGTYKVDKDKLSVKVTVNDQAVEESLTIKKATDDTLELEDKDKKVEVLKKKK